MAQNIVVDRFLYAGEEPVETLTPIAGYEPVDLVSLEDVVKPLEPLPYNLNAMVHTAKRSSCQPADGLTQDESAAVLLCTIQWPKSYTSLYTEFNPSLPSWKKESILALFISGSFAKQFEQKNRSTNC